MAKNGVRARSYAMILYAESMHADWEETLKKEKINGFAIYHDRDVKDDGEPKKPHYHILIRYKNQTAKATVKELAKQVGAANEKIIVVKEFRKYAEYLIHKNNPEKVQYEINDVKSYGEVDYKKLITNSERNQDGETLKEILDFCIENNVYSYADLLDYALQNNDDWFRLVSGRYMRCIATYLKSRYWTETELMKFGK